MIAFSKPQTIGPAILLLLGGEGRDEGKQKTNWRGRARASQRRDEGELFSGEAANIGRDGALCRPLALLQVLSPYSLLKDFYSASVASLIESPVRGGR